MSPVDGIEQETRPKVEDESNVAENPVPQLAKREILAQEPTSQERFEQEIIPSTEQLEAARKEMSSFGEPSWTDFARDPQVVANRVRSYAERLDQPEADADRKALAESLTTLSDEQYDALTAEVTSTMLALSQARLELAFGLEGKLDRSALLINDRDAQAANATMLQTELKHHDEVIRLASKFIEPLKATSRVDHLLTLISAAGHDIDKYARQPDGQGGLRRFEGPKDGLNSLFHHEVVSADNLATLGALSVWEKINQQFGIKLSRGSFETAAAMAAGHGKGEFPEKMARTGFFNKELNDKMPYYQMILNEDNLPSVVVHLADYISGTFGKERAQGDIKSPLGVSFYKYFLADLRSNPSITVEQSINASLATTAEGKTETQRLLLALDHKQPQVAEQIRKSLDEYVGAAVAFREWVKIQPTTQSEIQAINMPPPTDEASKSLYLEKKMVAMKNLFTEFSAQITPAESQRGLAIFNQEFPAMLDQRIAFLSDRQTKLITQRPELARTIPLGVTARQVEQGAEVVADWQAADALYLRRSIADLTEYRTSLGSTQGKSY